MVTASTSTRKLVGNLGNLREAIWWKRLTLKRLGDFIQSFALDQLSEPLLLIWSGGEILIKLSYNPMTKQHPITAIHLALLDIQNNLTYIEKELPLLKIDSAEAENIKAVTSHYFTSLFDAMEQLVMLGQDHAVFIIDPLLQELSDAMLPNERIKVIQDILDRYNTELKRITDSIIARRDSIDTAGDYGSLLVLMTESVGNILHLTRAINEAFTSLQTNQ